MNDIIEFKFKEKGQYILWSHLPVIMSVSLDWDKSYEFQIVKAIRELKELYRMVEIRWNYYGSFVGHYVDGNVSRYLYDGYW